MDKLIGIREASEIIGCSIGTLRRWDSEGKLKAVRFQGGNRRYKISDIEKFMSKE